MVFTVIHLFQSQTNMASLIRALRPVFLRRGMHSCIPRIQSRLVIHPNNYLFTQSRRGLFGGFPRWKLHHRSDVLFNMENNNARLYKIVTSTIGNTQYVDSNKTLIDKLEWFYQKSKTPLIESFDDLCTLENDLDKLMDSLKDARDYLNRCPNDIDSKAIYDEIYNKCDPSASEKLAQALLLIKKQQSFRREMKYQAQRDLADNAENIALATTATAITNLIK